ERGIPSGAPSGILHLRGGVVARRPWVEIAGRARQFLLLVALCHALPCAATTVTLQRGLQGTVEDTSIESGLGAAGGLSLLRIYSGSARNLGPKILLRFSLPSLSATTSVSRADLQLYLVSGATSESFALFPVTRAWTEDGASWMSYDGTQTW